MTTVLALGVGSLLFLTLAFLASRILLDLLRDPEPYLLREDLLSADERAFFPVLRSAAGETRVVLAKVALADLLRAPGGRRRNARLRSLSGRHLDFLVCDLRSMRPIVGVVFEGKSGAGGERSAKAAELDRLMDGAKLPILREKAQPAYIAAELGRRINEVLGPSGEADTPRANHRSTWHTSRPRGAVASNASDPTRSPFCPRCGSPMVLRTISRGRRVGESFWSCASAPRCRQVLTIPAETIS